MTRKIYRRSTCRLCESNNLKSVLKMVDTPIGDAYLPKEEVKEQDTYPVELFLCLDCGHAQLLDVIDQGEIYGEYIYKTSDSLGLIDHFSRSVDSIIKKIAPKEGDLVVDIGSNDGSFLSLFKKKNLKVLGIEPAKAISEMANKSGIETINEFFNPEMARKIKAQKGPAKIVTCNNTFANIDNLNEVIKGVKELLSSDGVFVIETGYVLDLIDKLIFDNIYHEHISYFSVKPIQNFFKINGMELIDVERIAPKGGSIRCTAQLSGENRKKAEIVHKLVELESNKRIHDPATFKDFEERLKQIKNKTMNLLQQLKSQGKSVAGYGASVGVTTVCYNFGITKELIMYLADDNKSRQGLFSPGKHIPVLPPESLIKDDVEYTIILAWMYNDPIMKRNQEYVKKGGKFITILPKQEIISQVGKETIGI